MARISAKLPQGSQSIPTAMTFRQWCEDLASRGMKIDGKPFTWTTGPR